MKLQNRSNTRQMEMIPVLLEQAAVLMVKLHHLRHLQDRKPAWQERSVVDEVQGLQPV